jgi:hypothetical protein
MKNIQLIKQVIIAETIESAIVRRLLVRISAELPAVVAESLHVSTMK